MSLVEQSVADPLLDSVTQSLSGQVSIVKDFYRNLLVEEFTGLGSWREPDVRQWLQLATPLVNEAQLTVMDMANASMDMQLQILLDGEYSTPYMDVQDVTGPGIRNGVPIQDVYGRIFKPVWQALGDGYDLSTAVERGVGRLSSTFDVDIERVIDHVNLERFANENRIVGYRRVLRGAHNCALCILASTQLYHKRQLKGIHPNCKCKVSPVLSFEDISKTLRQDLIDQVHASIKERYGISDPSGRAIDYRHIVMVRDHGELGPMLTFRDHHFTGPSAIKTPGE